MRRLTHGIDVLVDLALSLAAVGVLIMTAIMAVGVGARYLFGQPLPWADDAVRYVLVFSVMLAAADVMRRGDDIKVDLILDHLGARGRRVIEIAGLVAALIFATALVLLGVDMVSFAREMCLTTAGTIDIPSHWVEIALPMGGGLIALATIARLIRVIGGGDPTEPAQGHADTSTASDRQ